MVYMVTEERMGSPEAVVIYIFCIHNMSPTKSIANLSLLITDTFFRHATRSSGAWQDKTAAWDWQIPYALCRLLCRHERCLPTKKLEKRCVTKQGTCCTGLTCRHSNTKSWYCYYILLLTIWYNERSSPRSKKKITKNTTSVPCALQSVFVECYSKDIKTAPKFKTPLIRTGA